MNNSEIKILREQFHIAIRDHETAVQEFLTSRTVQSSARMSATYEHADILREQLRRLRIEHKKQQEL